MIFSFINFQIIIITISQILKNYLIQAVIFIKIKVIEANYAIVITIIISVNFNFIFMKLNVYLVWILSDQYQKFTSDFNLIILLFFA